MKALPVEPSNVPVAIGSRIRAARQSQRLTIEQVADATGLTKGFLSRVERDLTSPSVASLVTLCQVLSISIGDLFAAPETHLTKRNDGPRISLGGQGIVERLLTARSERRVQIIQAVIEPHGRGESELYAVDCDVDVLHVIKGSIKLILTNEEYDLGTGDTVTFPGREPHTWVNPTDKPVEVLGVLVPAASRYMFRGVRSCPVTFGSPPLSRGRIAHLPAQTSPAARQHSGRTKMPRRGWVAPSPVSRRSSRRPNPASRSWPDRATPPHERRYSMMSMWPLDGFCWGCGTRIQAYVGKRRLACGRSCPVAQGPRGHQAGTARIPGVYLSRARK